MGSRSEPLLVSPGLPRQGEHQSFPGMPGNDPCATIGSHVDQGSVDLDERPVIVLAPEFMGAAERPVAGVEVSDPASPGQGRVDASLPSGTSTSIEMAAKVHEAVS